MFIAVLGQRLNADSRMTCGRKPRCVYDRVRTPPRGSWVTTADADSSVFGVPAAEAAVPRGQRSKS